MALSIDDGGNLAECDECHGKSAIPKVHHHKAVVDTQ